jgi:hypothetical protein
MHFQGLKTAKLSIVHVKTVIYIKNRKTCIFKAKKMPKKPVKNL